MIGQYKHYNLEVISTKKANVLNIDGKIIFTGTEKQAKKWIDTEWDLTQDVIEHKDVTAHYIGDKIYNVNFDGLRLGQVKIETEKYQVPDWSGKRDYKNKSKHIITVTINLGYNVQVTLTDNFFGYGQMKTELKKVMVALKDKTMGIHLTSQLEIDAKKAGFSELSILDCFDVDRYVNAKNLAAMIA